MPSTSVARRRSRGGLAAGAAGAAVALVVALAACTSPAPTVSSAPSADASASSEPIFASDEEALAAAVAAYERHLSISAAILARSSDIQSIRDVTWPDYEDQRVQELTAFLDAGLRSSGTATVDTTSLVERHEASGVTTVAIYACQDVTGIQLFNDAGADVTPTDRDNRVPLVLEFRGTTSNNLMLSGNQQWTGKDFC